MINKKDYFIPMVQNQIGGYQFKNLNLLEQAFTRRSYTEEHGGENNEVLEFVGDKVLDVAVIRYLVRQYGTDLHIEDKIPAGFRPQQPPQSFASELDEGGLTRLKQKMVQKTSLARRMEELDLTQFLIMGAGDDQRNVSQSDSVKEDLFEAIVGAVALDSNWNFEDIQKVVETMLRPDSFIEDGEPTDYVSLIYEWDNRKNGCNPHFKFYDQGVTRWMYFKDPNVVYEIPQGTYECNHFNKACQVKLITDNAIPIFEGYGETNNQARRSACKAAYEYLKKKGMLLSIKDEIDNPNVQDAINQLEILSRRGYFPLPEYTYEESHDKDGNPIWHVVCKIDGVKQEYQCDSSSKKQAKKQVAFEMLKSVLEDHEVSAWE